MFYHYPELGYWRCHMGRFSYIIRHNEQFDKYLVEIWRDGYPADLFAMNTLRAAKEKASRQNRYYRTLYGNKYKQA